jgi:hypothetical protein
LGWPDLDPHIRELAEELLTDRQLAAFKLAEDGAGLLADRDRARLLEEHGPRSCEGRSA